jgi:phenylpropionate dioxygenase-like ring-hydroxylating dioxygenase large terminal subunit
MESSATLQSGNCRLPEVAMTEWMGFLFVSLSDDPPDLASSLAPLTGRIHNYHLEQMKLRFLEQETWDTNWKCLFENFMEGYHLSPLHRSTLHKVNPTRLCRHFPAGDSYLGYTVGFTTRVDENQVGHPDLDDEERNTCVMFAVPPGLVVGIGSDYSSFLSLQPDGAERVRVKMGLYFHGDDWSKSSVDEAVRLFRDTMAEDKAVLLRLQQGLRSRHYEPGPLAPPDLEGTCHDLQQFLARNMADPPGSPPRHG